MSPRPERLYRETGLRLRRVRVLLLCWVPFALVGIALGLRDLGFLETVEELRLGRHALEARTPGRIRIVLGWVALFLVTAVPYGRLVGDLKTNVRRLELRRRGSDWSLTRVASPWGWVFVVVAAIALSVSQEGLTRHVQGSDVEELRTAVRLGCVGDGLLALGAVLMVVILQRLQADLDARHEALLDE